MISAQCLWAMDFQCTGIQLLLLSAEKPYVLTVYIKKEINNVFRIRSQRNELTEFTLEKQKYPRIPISITHDKKEERKIVLSKHEGLNI